MTGECCSDQFMLPTSVLSLNKAITSSYHLPPPQKNR